MVLNETLLALFFHRGASYTKDYFMLFYTSQNIIARVHKMWWVDHVTGIFVLCLFVPCIPYTITSKGI